MATSYIRRRESKTKGVRWLAVFEFEDRSTGERSTLSKTFDKQREAKGWIDEQKAKRDSANRFSKPSMQPLGIFLDKWLAEGLSHLAISTRSSYEEIVRLYLRPNLAAAPLAQLSTFEIQKLVNRLQSQDGLSVTTVRYVVTVLRIALSKAVKWGEIPTNPTKGVELPKKENSESPSSMTPAEAARFVEALKGEAFETLFLVLLHCGVRPGEAFALRWSDLDLDGARTLSVNRALQRSGDGETVFADPKTKRSKRDMELSQTVVKALIAHRKASQESALKSGRPWPKDELVFPSTSGGPLDVHNVRRAFRRITKKAGLGKMIPSEGRRGPRHRFVHAFRMYDLRHTCATLQLEAGIDARTVSESLGHASVAFTLDTYAHSRPEMKRAAANKLESLIAAHTTE